MMRMSAFDWQAWIAGSVWLRGLVVSLAVLVLVSLGWGVSLRDTHQRLDQAAASGRHLIEALAARKGQGARLMQQRDAFAEARQMLQEARWRLAAGEAMSDLLDALAVSGQAHGLVFEAVEVLPRQDEAGFGRTPLEIRVVGRYPSLRGWLEHCAQQLRLLQVTRVNLAALADGDGRVRAQVRVSAYDAGEALPIPTSLAHEPARPAPAVSAFDPFLPAAAGQWAEELERIPLEQLAMVGSLARGGEYQALVQAAGRLHWVKRGQRLGRDEGVVVGIDADGIEVHERLYLAGGWQQRSRYLALGKGARGEVTDDVEAGKGGDVAGAADGQPPGVGIATER